MTSPTIGALLLAAGRSTRMGERQKLLEVVRGRPLVRWAVEAAVQSAANPVIVVLGHRSDDVAMALPPGLNTVFNSDYVEGLSTSLAAGLRALPAGLDGAVVLLGDMPDVGPAVVDDLIDAWTPGSICVSTHKHRRGNPVLWDASFFPEMLALSGDKGARSLMLEHADSVVEVSADASVLHDLDTPEDLDQARRED